MKPPALTDEVFNALVNNSDAGIIYYSFIRDNEHYITDFRYEFINDTALKLIRRLKPEFIGTSMLSHYDNNADLSFVDKFKEAGKTGKVINYTLTRMENGNERWFRNKLVKYRDGLILYFYDETEKLKISGELEYKNRLFQKLVQKREGIFSEVLNQAFDGVFYLIPVWDEKNNLIDFKIVFANESALKSLNMTQNDIYPSTFLNIFPKAKENGTFYMYEEAYKKGLPSRKLVDYDDGRTRGWYRVDSFRYEDGVIVYFRDETLSVQHEKRIEQQNKDLQSLVNQKELLLQETHHRVKNNMQVIASLLNLQSRIITDPAALEAFQVSIQRIQTMSLIHEKLYRENNFEKMHFEGFVSDVISSIRGFYVSNKDIHFKYDIEDIYLPISTCINLGLILNELFSNSIKHAFPDQEKGDICISSKADETNLLLVVRDNGKGIPDNIDLKNLSSMGLTIVHLLIEQMDGTLKIENNMGASFNISIPLS